MQAGGELGDSQTKGPSGSRNSRGVEVRGDMQPCPKGQRPGWGSNRADTNGEEGCLWDGKTGQILWPDGTPTRSTAAMAAEAERLIDEQAVQVWVDFCAGTQSMGPVYRSKRNVMYIPLDAKGAVFSAARQKKAQNVPYHIMKSSPEEIMGIVVQEVK